MRVERLLLVVVTALCSSALTAVDNSDEADTLAKIELLGGNVTRDEKRPGAPVIGVWFGEKCRFNDKYFHLLKPFKDLTTLEFRFRSFEEGAKITDAGAIELKELENLEELDISYAHVTDHCLKELRFLKKLKTLSLSGSRITDQAFQDLSQFENLAVLDIGNNLRITGTGISQLVRLKFLEDLSLSNTQLAGNGLKELAELKQLTTLSLVRTPTGDVGLKDLSDLKNLTTLKLNFAEITDKGLTAR